MFKNVSIIRKLNSETSERVEYLADVVERAAADCNLPVGDIRTKDTLLIAIGGDGTMLEAMRQAVLNGATCLGINLGRVGFLTDLSLEESVMQAGLYYKLCDIMTDEIGTWVEERRLLMAYRPSPDKVVHVAGNEVSVSTKYSDSMICYQLKIGNMSAGVHRANSVLVTSATGSTAYSLSAGGALMMPDLRSMQIVPVAPLTMTSRPIVVPSHVEIEITAWGGPISVRYDGQVDKAIDDTVYTKEDPFVIKVGTFAHPAKLLHLDGWNYFDVLTQKLGWMKE